MPIPRNLVLITATVAAMIAGFGIVTRKGGPSPLFRELGKNSTPGELLPVALEPGQDVVHSATL